MRYRLGVLILIAVLPLMNLLAAPAPQPAYAILDIGPPPKGWSLEKHRKTETDNLTYYFFIACNIDPQFRNHPAVARLKEVRPWLAKNLRVKEENGGQRLRLTFFSGGRVQQVTILNGLLRANLKVKEDRIKYFEECISSHEQGIADLEQRIKSEQNRDRVDSYRKKINDLRSNRIPACRAEINRLKQFTVIKWAEK